MPIPKLERSCGSWICSDPESGRETFETFREEVAEQAERFGYLVETAAQYLGRLNQALTIRTD